jgi:hypothetical protein
MTEQELRDAAIACALLGREFEERKEAITRDLFAHTEQIDELPDGYRLPPEDPGPPKILEFITTERQCCPFFTFELTFESNGGPLWLRLRGSEEIKAFIRAELAATSG